MCDENIVFIFFGWSGEFTYCDWFWIGSVCIFFQIWKSREVFWSNGCGGKWVDGDNDVVLEVGSNKYGEGKLVAPVQVVKCRRPLRREVLYWHHAGRQMPNQLIVDTCQLFELPLAAMEKRHDCHMCRKAVMF